ncbi:hypothetical protein [Streptomyces sp. NPDC060031]|uniref:hypothetical protein n=1 Tax=Streptomyces sp. NPDC060031 TaxID=3347043 RepID=UPI003691393D
MKSNRIIGSVTAAVFVAAGSAGCSATAVTQKAGESAQNLVAALSRASDEASKAGSADISMTLTTPDTGGKPMQMKGLYSWGNGLAMETEMPAKDLQMEDMVADGTITMRLVQGAYYYEVDPAPDGPFQGKTWLKVEASAVMGEKGAASMNGANADPTSGLKGLKYAKDVTKVATENVNGKSTVHYRASVPADRLGAASDMYKGLGMTGEVVTDVWVDDKGTPARMNQVIGTSTISVDFLSFGSQRSIDVPPAADTADVTERFKQQAQGGSA